MRDPQHGNINALCRDSFRDPQHGNINALCRDSFRDPPNGNINALYRDYGLRFGMCVPRDAELNLWTYRPDYLPNINRFKEVSSVQQLDRDNEGGRYFWDRTNGRVILLQS